MKIVNILYSGFGGLASVVHELVRASGAEVHEWVMVYYGVVPLDRSHQRFCSEYGFRYVSFRPKPGRPWRAWFQLARWLIAERPDAIICHSSTAMPPAAMAARWCGVPLIAVEHTSNELKSYTEWAGSCAAMLLADRVVVLTEIYAKLLAARLGLLFRASKIRCIPNGLDISVFHPRSDVSLDHRLQRAGMAARLASTKLHPLLIDLSDELGFPLSLAGDGELMASLQAYAESKPRPKVIFCGYVPARDMAAWFRGLDLYLHASKGETFSMSILQAMATGLPIIASDLSGMDEILGRDGSCGLLVPNTHSAWREAIAMLLENPALRERMGASARQRALRLFSAEAMLAGYLSAVEETIK